VGAPQKKYKPKFLACIDPKSLGGMASVPSHFFPSQEGKRFEEQHRTVAPYAVSILLPFAIATFEPRKLLKECQGDFACGTIALLRDNQLGFASFLPPGVFIGFVIFGPDK
jgi:hypothetical protein